MKACPTGKFQSVQQSFFMTEQSLGITHKNATFHFTNFVIYELVWVLWGYFMVFVTAKNKDNKG